jgi:hypothetical protein
LSHGEDDNRERLKHVDHTLANTQTSSHPSQPIPTGPCSFIICGNDEVETKQVILRVRKKSGELVKPALRSSCSSRSSSANGTTSSRKAVHFSETIEQVRGFLQKDKPSSISAESSPVYPYEDWVDSRLGPNIPSKSGHVEWTIETNAPNDDCEASSMHIRIQRLKLSKDNEKLVGVVAVTNLAYQKLVSVTFTFDSWETKSEIDAEYSSIRTKKHSDGLDRFQFAIDLSDHANLQNKTLILCARYNAAGQEYWDSNGGNNYRVTFTRTRDREWSNFPTSSAQSTLPPHSRSWNAFKARIPWPKQFKIDESGDHCSSQFERLPPIHKEHKSDASKSHYFQYDAEIHSTNRLSNRYDFHKSLHASAATTGRAFRKVQQSQLLEPVRLVKAPTPRPIVKPSLANRSARPTISSTEYQILIEKFCHFRSTSIDHHKIENKMIDLSNWNRQMACYNQAQKPMVF